MSNDIRTRRILVTLPDLEADAADIAVKYLLDVAPIRWGRKFGATVTVEHLNDNQNSGVQVDAFASTDRPGSVRTFNERFLSPEDARKLAALLLRAADEAEGRA